MSRISLLILAVMLLTAPMAAADNWYEKSFWLLHEDHHTQGQFEVGRDADLEETARLVGLIRPDMIQIHAKGNPGWTTYPTEIGYAPPKLVRDVLAIWRDVARRDGYSFSAYYNIGRDGQIMTLRPEWNRVQADGKPVERALCYHSGVAEEYLWPMVREVIDGYRPDGFWFDGSCFTIRACYCPKCERRFRRQHLLAPPKTPAERGWNEYQEMQRRIYREFIRGTTELIHAADPDCLVSVNWAYSIRMPEKPDPGIAYLTGDIGNRVEGLSPEAHWYDSVGLPFDLMTQVNTLQAIIGSDGQPSGMRTAPKPRSQIEQEMAVIVANGGRYNAWDTPTPQSGLTPERFEFMGRVVTPFLRERQPWCLGFERVPDVSLLHSAAAHYAANDKAAPSFNRANNRIDGASAALVKQHLNYEMLPDWRLHEQDVRGRLLIVEHPKVLTQRTVESLIHFVSEGGSLLITGMGLSQSEELRKTFGIAKIDGSSGSEPLSFKSADGDEPFGHWLSRVTPSTASVLLNVSDADGDRYPLLTQSEHGRGKAFYVPIPLLTLHGKDIVPRPLLDHVFDLVLPPSERLLSTDAPDTVEVVLRKKDRRHVVHLVNMAPGTREVFRSGNRRHTKITAIEPAPECRIVVKTPGRPVAVELQPQGTSLHDWHYEGGRVEIRVPGFDIHQMVVLGMYTAPESG